MHQTTMTAEMQALMDHTGWVQELAHKLVRDPNVADDLAQETLLAALKGGAAVRFSKAWLGTVLRNLLWQRMRGERRRRSREQQVSRDEGTPSSADLVERMSAHREVVNTVMALPEHYRIVLLRRYFEGETPTEIAAHMEIPVSTVKTRLQRALDLMRQRLDADHGKDGSSWMVALVPLLRDGAPVAPPVPVRTLALGSCGVIMVATVAVAWPWGGSDSVPISSAGGEPLSTTAQLGTGGAGTDATGPERAAVALDSNVSGPAFEEFNRAPRPLRGRVFNAQGEALSGVVVTFTPLIAKVVDGTPIGISGSEGAFEIPRALGTGLVKAASSDLVTVIAGMAIGDRKNNLNVVVAPRHSVRGTVTDSFGRPLANSSIELEPPAGFAGRFGQIMQNAQSLRHRVVSSSDGSYTMERVPSVAGSLVVRREGFLPITLPQPAGDDAVVNVTLHAPEKSSGMIEGHVHSSDGIPLADVRVSCGLEVTRTDEAGRFLLDVTGSSQGVKSARLIAVSPGFRPAFLDAEREPETREPVWPDNIELTLSGEPLEISGRVVNPEGRGLAGMRVWIKDPTILSHSPGVPGRGYETNRYASSELDYPDNPEVLESYLAGHPDDAWHTRRTDADGVFRIGGLADRAYTLVAMDWETLVTAESQPVAAGSEATLTLDLTDIHESLNGRVIDRAGRPVSGVRVQAQRTAFALEFEGRVIQRTSTSCAITVTDLDGSFSFYDVARDGTMLRLDGVGIVPSVHPLGPDAAMEITVARHVHMQVFSSMPGDGQQIGVLDDSGEELQIHIIQGTQRQVMRRADLVEGRSGVLSVPDHATALVLYAGEELERTLPLQLAPGRVNQIRL